MAPVHDRPFPEFWLRIRELHDREWRPPDAHTSPLLGWMPSEEPQAFEIINPGPWYIYKHGGQGEANTLTPGPQHLPSHVEIYDTTSLFYSTELNHFLEVPYDCTSESVTRRKTDWPEDGWNRVTFSKSHLPAVRAQHEHLWIIGHALYNNKQIDQSINITNSWNNLLLPGSFFNGIQNINTLPTCELAGKLTMIMGLVAFATHPNDLVGMIQASFRHPGTSYYVPTWQTGRVSNQGLINKRGLVVEVAFDKTKHQKYELENWEWGKHGPILTSNPRW